MTESNISDIPRIGRESLVVERLPLDGGRVIDIGCGEGWLTHLVATEQYVDPSKIYDIAIEVAPIIPPDEDVTTELICGSEYWEPLSRYRRILAGMCMSYLVRNRKVPYRKSGKPCQSPKLYQSLEGA